MTGTEDKRTSDESAVATPSVWLQVLVLTVLFLGGGLAGASLSNLLAPESILAQFVGLFTFAFPFILGMHYWLGLAIVIALWRLARHGRAGMAKMRVKAPPGSIVFVPTCTVLVGVAGLLIGMLGSSLGIVATVGLYLLAGLAYGTACWLAARSGYLPFLPE